MLRDHGDNVFANCQSRPVEPVFHTDDFALFHHGRVHELLIVDDGTGFNVLGLHVDPSCPRLGLLDLGVDHKHVVELLVVRDIASEDEEAEEILVDQGDVELAGGQIVGIEAVHGVHGQADR